VRELSPVDLSSEGAQGARMSAAENLRLKVLLTWAVGFVERETQVLHDSYVNPDGVLTMDDEIDEYIATDIEDARRWLLEAREALA
jgi:hypothetical protein